MTEDARRYAPAVARNREPILEVLQRYLPLRGLVLVRDIEAVATLAAAHGFAEPLITEMPANNLSLFFERRA